MFLVISIRLLQHDTALAALLSALVLPQELVPSISQSGVQMKEGLPEHSCLCCILCS